MAYFAVVLEECTGSERFSAKQNLSNNFIPTFRLFSSGPSMGRKTGHICHTRYDRSLMCVLYVNTQQVCFMIMIKGGGV